MTTTDTTPPTFDVTPVIEQDRDGTVHHDVQVTLSDVAWRMLVGDVAARMVTLRSHSRPLWTRVIVAGHRPTSLTQQAGLDELVGELDDPGPGQQVHVRSRR